MARLTCVLAFLAVGCTCAGKAPLPDAPEVDAVLTRATSKAHAFAGQSAAKRENRTQFLASIAEKQAPTTTPDPFAKGASAAEMSGVQENGSGDLAIFLTGLATNTTLILVFFAIFCILRTKIPMVYAGRVVEKTAPFQPSDSLLGWVWASFNVSIDDYVAHCGLDQAMLIEFTHFAMSLLSFLMVPLLFIMGPVHCFFGGNRSGDDRLSKLGMANVVDNHPYLYWVHAGLVWFVVVVVQRFIYSAQRKFLQRRKDWLKAMPTPRATTLLVMNIPEEHCTDKQVKAYFKNAFEKDVVEHVHVIKHTEYLLELTATKAGYDLKLDEAVHKEKKTGERPTYMCFTSGSHDAIDYWTEQNNEVAKSIKEERKRIQNAVYAGDASVFAANAFVTFKSRRDSEMALKADYTPDDDEFVCEIPPDPSDVIFTDLQKDPMKANMMAVVGYGLIALVFWAYMPAVIGIAYYTDLDNLAKVFPAFQSMADDPSTATMWEAMMGSLALQLFISFVPTFFVHIFTFCFILKAHAWLQHRIQNWYYWFQVVYVLLVTAVGSSIIKTLDEIIEQPTYVFYLLATTMPFATHFYLNFIPLQWVTHAQNMLRTSQLGKFFFFRTLYGDEVAKQMAEPEDQDYYGIGSRSARHSFLLALVLVFCTLTPLVNLLGFVNFFVSRLVYGYLIPFAETRKPDLGGVFWVTNLMNLQRTMIIFIFLMTGVLCFRFEDSPWPCMIAAASGVFWYISFSRFQGTFRWESLCLEDFADLPTAKKDARVGSYAQAELGDA